MIKTQELPLKTKRILSTILFALFIFALLLFTYHDAFNNFFLAEDGKWLYRARMLEKDFSSFLQSFDGRFRSFVIVIFLAAYKLFGYQPAGYYFVNVVFHFVNALLLFALTKKICRHILPAASSWGISFLTSFFFAFHSMNCVPVLWISLIHDLLSAMFYVLSILFFLKFVEAERPLNYVLSLVFFLLSAAMKEAAASLPFVLLLLYAFIFRIKSKKYLLPVSLFFLVDIILFHSYTQSPGLITLSLTFFRNSSIIFTRHIVEAMRAFYGFSQNKTLWYEPYFSHLFLQKMQCVHILMAISLIFFFSVVLRRPREIKHSQKSLTKVFAFSLIWMLLTFSPHFTIQHLILWDWVAFSPGYHYFYLSSFGVCFMMSSVIMTFSEPVHEKLIKRAAIIFVVVSFFLNNFFPIQHMEKVYAYHAATLHYLLDQIRSAVTHEKDTQIVLVDFPSQYQSLHYAGLPDFLKFFGIPLTTEKILWINKNELEKRIETITPGQHLIILNYKHPFVIPVTQYHGVQIKNLK